MKKVKFFLSENVSKYLLKEMQELEFSEPIIQIIWGRWDDKSDFEWIIGFNYKSNLPSSHKENRIYYLDKFEFYIQEDEWNDRLEGKLLGYINGKFIFE